MEDKLEYIIPENIVTGKPLRNIDINDNLYNTIFNTSCGGSNYILWKPISCSEAI